MRRLVVITTLVAIALSHSVNADVETLQNDGFVSGGFATFQAGFIQGEIGAARFVPQLQCPCVIDSVTLLFGGANVTEEVGLLIWEDAAGANAPGALLFSGTVTMTGSNTALQEIDLSLSPIFVTGPFRVGIEFSHNSLPSLATDEDGTIDAGANFISAHVGGFFLWFQSATFGVSGDFIIRANIDNLLSPDTDGDGISDDVDNCTLLANADQRDSNNDGYGNLCDADINNDCSINFSDLNLIKAVFFGNDPDADLNGDSFVNFADLELVKQQFFGTPGPSGITTDCDSRL